jgi:acyl-CoA reductase-like NAD-dependent aldehyde dehydrogenase
MTDKVDPIPETYKRKLVSQRERVTMAQEILDAEMEKLRDLAVLTCNETGAPMQAVGDVIGYTRQRIFQFIQDADQQP